MTSAILELASFTIPTSMILASFYGCVLAVSIVTFQLQKNMLFSNTWHGLGDLWKVLLTNLIQQLDSKLIRSHVFVDRILEVKENLMDEGVLKEPCVSDELCQLCFIIIRVRT